MIATSTILSALAELESEGCPTTGYEVARRVGSAGPNVRNTLSLACRRGLVVAGGMGCQSAGYQLTPKGRRQVLIARIGERLDRLSFDELNSIEELIRLREELFAEPLVRMP